MRNLLLQSGSLACLAGLTLLLSQPARAQETTHNVAVATATKAGPSAAKTTGTEENRTSQPDDADDGSIRVHGHWVLEVNNADGTLADRREFENSLVTSGTFNTGAQLMAAALSGNVTLGAPGLALLVNGGADPTTLCVQLVGFSNNCVLFAAAGTLMANTGAQLGLSEVVNFSPTTNMVLSGTYRQAAGASVTYAAVESLFPACIPNGFAYENVESFQGYATLANANMAPNNCQLASLSGAGDNSIVVPLTYTLITNSLGTPAPLTLAPNQTITIAFTLSFS